jgi:ATP-dependent Lon protease
MTLPKKSSKTTNKQGSQSRPSLTLYNEGDLAALIHASESLAGNDEVGVAPSEEAKRLAFLKSIAGSFIGPQRALIVANDALIERLEKLAMAAPNAAPLVELYIREAWSSLRTGVAMTMPPVLMLGPPGVGKTHVARRLALALETAFVPVEMPMMDDIGDLCGHTLSWKAARAGVVARTLLDEPWACPMILLDELEKAPRYSHSQAPLDIFHTLFEPESARRFKDQYARIEMRADHIFWVATANTTEGIPPAVLDRCLVVTIDRPSPAEGRSIADAIFRAFAMDRPGSAGYPTRALLDFLAPHSPRRMRRLLHLAAGFAAQRDATALSVCDLESALTLVETSTSTPHRIGFV